MVLKFEGWAVATCRVWLGAAPLIIPRGTECTVGPGMGVAPHLSITRFLGLLFPPDWQKDSRHQAG